MAVLPLISHGHREGRGGDQVQVLVGSKLCTYQEKKYLYGCAINE